MADTRKRYGRAKSGATKKASEGEKKPAAPRKRASRAKTEAGRKRAIVREQTRLAQERFREESLKRQRREELKAQKEAGIFKPRARTLVSEALRQVKKAVLWLEDQVHALRTFLLGPTQGIFEEALSRPSVKSELARTHEGHEAILTRPGERITRNVRLLLTPEFIDEKILTLLDQMAEQIIGSYEIWNASGFFLSTEQEQGSPIPMQGLGEFHAFYEASGIAETYRHCREKFRAELFALFNSAKPVFLVHIVLFSSSPSLKRYGRGRRAS